MTADRALSGDKFNAQLRKVKNPLGVIWGYPPLAIDPNDPPDFAGVLNVRIASEFKGRGFETYGLVISDVDEEIAGRLTNSSYAEELASFPGSGWADNPGMYAWHGDDEACALLGSILNVEPLKSVLYVGQAGASSKQGKPSGATLHSRIVNEHIEGKRRSTFRKSLACVLAEHLALTIEPDGTCKGESRERLSAWMRAHLRVVVAVHFDRDALRTLESQVVRRLDPPLNLAHCDPSDVRARVLGLRRRLGVESGLQ